MTAYFTPSAFKCWQRRTKSSTEGSREYSAPPFGSSTHQLPQTSETDKPPEDRCPARLLGVAWSFVARWHSPMLVQSCQSDAQQSESLLFLPGRFLAACNLQVKCLRSILISPGLVHNI